MRVEPPVPDEVLAAIRQPLAESALRRAGASLLQPLSLLLDLAGEAMRSRLFVVQSEEAGEQCLRPDFTVAVAREFLDEIRDDEGRFYEDSGCTYFYEGPAYRASPGTDRPEEFLQVGMEVFYPEAPLTVVDAEVVTKAWRAAEAGGRSDLSLVVGDIALLAAFIDTLALPQVLAARLKRVAGRPRLLAAELARQDGASEDGALASVLRSLSEKDAALLLEEVWALAGIQPVGGRAPAEIAARLVRKSEAAAAPALTPDQADAIRTFMEVSATPEIALKQVADLAGPERSVLKAALGAWAGRLERFVEFVPEDRIRFATNLGHAFDYYDGITFEIRSEALGSDRAVAVGGRYDGLLARLGGPTTIHAVGCMVRPWRAWNGGEQ